MNSQTPPQLPGKVLILFLQHTQHYILCFRSTNNDGLMVMFVADPQIVGIQDEVAVLGYITRWDCDRYNYKFNISFMPIFASVFKRKKNIAHRFQLSCLKCPSAHIPINLSWMFICSSILNILLELCV